MLCVRSRRDCADTDSVFVHIKEPDDAKAWELAERMAKYITDTIFAGTVNVLEDECLKRAFLLIGKKTYVGLENDKGSSVYNPGHKGLATVRRDRPKVLTNLLHRMSKAFTDLGHFPVETICKVLIGICCDHFEDIVQDRLPLDDYNIAQRVKKMGGDQAHICAARRMQERANIPINEGDAVNYVLTKTRSTKAKDMAESTEYVRSTGKPVDRHYYVEERVQKGVSAQLRLFMTEEVIDTMFNIYLKAIDVGGTAPISTLFSKERGKAGADMNIDRAKTAGQARKLMVLTVLERTIRSGRIARGAVLVTKEKVTKKQKTEAMKEQFGSIRRFMHGDGKVAEKKVAPAVKKTVKRKSMSAHEKRQRERKATMAKVRGGIDRLMARAGAKRAGPAHAPTKKRPK